MKGAKGIGKKRSLVNIIMNTPIMTPKMELSSKTKTMDL